MTPDGKKRQVGLQNQAIREVANWGTPRASDGEKGGPNQSFGAGGMPLPAQAAQWTTLSHSDQLPNAVAHGFTPPDLPTRQGGDMPSPHAPISRPLWAWMTQSLGRPVSRRLWKGRSRRRLNPLFVEWLMGWPPGHALCACSATEFTRWQRDMRGALSQLPMASGPWIWEPSADEPPEPCQIELI